MQMAAYVAKFAAIFVWFVWLCSNVQIVPEPEDNFDAETLQRNNLNKDN